jgi:histidinol-phosphate aminotransferase
MRTFLDLANPWVSKLGIYEPGRPIEEVARELGFEDPASIVKLASNENALGPSPRAVKAMRKAAAEMHRYPDGGAFYLRNTLAARLGLQPEQLVFGAGSNELIEFLCHVFLGPGTSIVMADRAFVVYRLMADMFQARTIAVPMKDLTHDLDAMRAAVAPDTRLVFIANPNNPTGTMVDGAAIDRFVTRAPDHVVTVLDEAYIELLPPAKQPDTLRYVREGRKVVLLRTFSKTYGLAGLRLGYAAAPAECTALLHRIRQPFNTNAMAQAAALAALDDGRYVARTRRLVGSGLRQLVRGFKALGLPFVPSVANFILVKVGAGRQVFQALEREGVIARPMDPYGLPEYIRITVGTKAENEVFLAALKKVLGK